MEQERGEGVLRLFSVNKEEAVLVKEHRCVVVEFCVRLGAAPEQNSVVAPIPALRGEGCWWFSETVSEASASYPVPSL